MLRELERIAFRSEKHNLGKIAFGGMIVAGLMAGMAVPTLAAEARGVLLRQEGAARVRIANCGASLCGTIVWLKSTGGSGRVGQRVFFDMKPDGSNTWAGSAFNPEAGNTYSGNLAVNGNMLTTTGCALGGLICKSMNWSRVD